MICCSHLIFFVLNFNDDTIHSCSVDLLAIILLEKQNRDRQTDTNIWLDSSKAFLSVLSSRL